MARKPRTKATHDTFIVATGRDTIKPNGDARKLIRSHVMQGKNTGKGKAIVKAKKTQNCRAVRSSDDLRVPSSAIETFPFYLAPSVHRTTPGNFTVGGLISEFIAIMKQAMYPIERYVGVGSDSPSSEWCLDSAMCRDTAYVHIVAYVAVAFFDTKSLCSPGSRNSSSQRALFHMTRGIRLLRRRIRAHDFAATDATIFLVLALGMFSEAHGELDAARKHMSGLYQLVQLRGGIHALSDRRFLQIKCCRLDLAVALRTGSQPLFFSDEVDNIGNLSSDILPLELGQKMESVASILPYTAFKPCNTDTQLAAIWLDLHTFTTAINLAQQTNAMISPKFYQDTLIAAHYRLHKLSPQTGAAGETCHVLRLAMLVFSTAVFLELRNDRFQSLASAFCHLLKTWHVEQDKVLRSSTPTGRQLQELNLWMIFVAAATVLRSQEHHQWLRNELRKTLRILQLTSWDMVSSVLINLLWVGAIHDEAAMAFFESLNKP